MNCKKIKLLLSAYLEGELDDQTRKRIDGHLESCSGCREAREEMKSYLAMAANMDRMEAPPWLEARIWQGIEEPGSAPHIPAVASGKVIFLRTVTMAAAILILAFLILPPRFYSPQELETSFSFRIEKKGKGPGKSRGKKDGTFAPGFQVNYAFVGPCQTFPGDYNGDGFDDMLVKNGSMDELGDWELDLNENGRKLVFSHIMEFGAEKNFIVE